MSAVKWLVLLAIAACSSQKDLPNAQGETPSSASRADEVWTLDVATCERNQIFTKNNNGPQSLTVVGKDGDACVVHVKHSVGRDWTESDCKVPRSAGTIKVTSTDPLPGTCTLVESGTEMR